MPFPQCYLDTSMHMKYLELQLSFHIKNKSQQGFFNDDIQTSKSVINEHFPISLVGLLIGSIFLQHNLIQKL